MKNKNYLLLALMVFIAFSSFAQQFGSNSIGSELNLTTEKVLTKKKSFVPDVSIAFGSSFSTFGKGFNAFGNFISPEFTFPINKKLAVKAGLAYSTLYYPNFGLENSSNSRTFDQYGSVYISGIYQLTEKLIVAGTAFKSFPLSEQSPQANPRALDFSNEGIILDMNYKLSDKVSVSAGFKYQKHNSYNYYNNFGGYNSFGAPFNNSLFGPNF